MPQHPQTKHAFTVNPAGPVPYSGFQAFGIFLVVLFPILALTACGLRVYSRRLSNKGLWLDDWLIFLATVLGIPQAVFAIFYIRAGYWGIHDVDIPPHPLNQGQFWSYMNRVFYTPLLTLVKISALLFLLSLGAPKTSVRLACKTLIVVCIMQLLAFFPATLFMCKPVEFVWVIYGKGRCIDAGPFTVTLATTNIATDILTLLIPFIAFMDLKLSSRIRFALLTVFTLGGLVTVISVLRLYFVIRVWYLKPTEDVHYSLGYTTNTIEVNLAIVTATIPALWPLARLWFPALFESLGINRPYLYPDIEVGYVLSSPSSSMRDTVVEAVQTPPPGSRPALRGKVLWLQRLRPPSYVRPTAAAATEGGGLAGGGGGSGVDSVGLTDIRRQRIFGTTTARDNRPLEERVDEEDVFDYHGMLRKTEIKLEHVEDDSSSNGGAVSGERGDKVEKTRQERLW